MAYVKNTWVDREGQTRYHETIDDDGALIFTPDYEKVTEIGTPVNADNMNHIEEGIENHENRITILEEAGDASNFLNKSQITNCLLEVPQNIKLELNDGTLTLKAGSKVIVPNGFEADGTTPKFDYVTIDVDLSKPTFGSASSQQYLIYGNDTNNINHFSKVSVFSGDTQPTTISEQYNLWYDTKNNVIKHSTDTGASWDIRGIALPLGLFTRELGVPVSIDQVFNGMGYIGSTIWVDKGVKGLFPNGRNENGDLNNIEATNTKLTTITVGPNQTNNSIRFRSNSLALGTLFYKEDTNYNYATANYTETRAFVEIGKYSSDANGKIQFFQAKLPFRAMDASTPHITETYVNGTSGYRIWSDKFCEQWGRAIPAAANNGTIEVTLLKAYKDINGMCLVTSPDITFISGGGINYGTSSAKFIANNKIRVKQATGSPEDSNIQWYTTGYLA